jgi:hypothetical protein
MNCGSMTLLNYLEKKFPNGINYLDAVNICMGLYVSENCIPSEILDEECTMDKLSITFANLSKLNKIHDYVPYKSVEFGANSHDVSDKGHWIEVLSSILKKGNSPDIDLTLKLLKSDSKSP